MLEINDFLFRQCDMTDQMAASIESYCEMYKRPYLQNHSTDLHKICGKMLASFTHFYWSDNLTLWALPCNVSDKLEHF